MKRRNFIKIAMGTIVAAPFMHIPAVYASKQDDSTTEDAVDYLQKMHNFDNEYKEDIFIPDEESAILNSVTKRLTRVEKTVGHANFMVLDIDTAIHTAKAYPFVSPFPTVELTFLEKLFYADVEQYGFLGEKTLKNLTVALPKKELIKVPHMGNFLYKEASYSRWNEIKKLLQNDVILTSGARGVVKQMHLFLKKVYANNGNISLASRSIAPPAYSFHSTGDFDVGKPNFGMGNFTTEFLDTDTYKKLVDAGFLTLRYYNKNPLGVRFEPWHIKV